MKTSVNDWYSRSAHPPGGPRRRVSWPLLLLALCLGAASAHAGGRELHRSFRAPTLDGSRRDLRVYLPPSYDLPEAAARRYPLLVLLHGWPGSEGNWPGRGRAIATLDSLIASGAIPEVIALFPDGSGEGLIGRSMWLDAADGRSDMEQFLVRDLPAWADTTFRTRTGAASRAVIGLSDGGTAAINLALLHPDVYGAGGSHSGDFLLRHDRSSARLFGHPDSAAARRAARSALLYLSAMTPPAGVTLYFDCGVADAAIADNRALDSLLTSMRVPHEYHEFAGSHTWRYWSAHLPQALRAVTARWR